MLKREDTIYCFSKWYINRGDQLEITYINIFQDTKHLAITVGSSYSKNELLHTFLDNLQQEEIKYGNISVGQIKLGREEK